MTGFFLFYPPPMHRHVERKRSGERHLVTEEYKTLDFYHVKLWIFTEKAPYGYVFGKNLSV